MQFANKVENGAKQLYANYINAKVENIKTTQQVSKTNDKLILVA